MWERDYVFKTWTNVSKISIHYNEIYCNKNCYYYKKSMIANAMRLCDNGYKQMDESGVRMEMRWSIRKFIGGKTTQNYYREGKS